jgi:hypothetical protein
VIGLPLIAELLKDFLLFCQINVEVLGGSEDQIFFADKTNRIY